MEKIKVLGCCLHYQSNFVREHMTCNFIEKICICWIVMVGRRKLSTLHYIMSRSLLSNAVIKEKTIPKMIQKVKFRSVWASANYRLTFETQTAVCWDLLCARYPGTNKLPVKPQLPKQSSLSRETYPPLISFPCYPREHTALGSSKRNALREPQCSSWEASPELMRHQNSLHPPSGWSLCPYRAESMIPCHPDF